MSRYDLTLNTSADKARAVSWIQRARQGWTMTIREPTRNSEQNAKLWAMLSEITAQRKVHNGTKMTPELWKCVFMHALGHETQFVPALDGSAYFPVGFRSSNLTKKEFSDLLELIIAWTVQEGITLHDGQDRRAA